MPHFIKLFSLVSVFSLISACGGSGGEDGDTDGTGGTSPVNPTGIVVAANDGENTLEWNSVSNATSYNIYWSMASGTGVSGTQISGVSSPYTHTGLTNGTTYYYVITAVNTAGESSPSVEVSGTPAIPPPDAPVLQSVIPDDQQNLLSWDPVSGATSYNLYWSTTSGNAASGTQISNVTSPYTHTSLTNGTTYYYVLTAVGTGGESSPSTEASGTPFVPPYATEEYPYNLGNAPIAGYNETIPDNLTQFHYTLSVTPGSVYMFNLNNVVDGASLEVFTDDSWDPYGLGLACSDYTSPSFKGRPQCIAIAPSSGLFYIRIGAEADYGEDVHGEEVSLQVDEVVNEGSNTTPVNLGTAPVTPTFGTVLEWGESIYQVNVTPGNYYRVMVTDWEDSGAALSRLTLRVHDGSSSDPELCYDYGGNSEVTHQHRLPVIHCLAKPTASTLTIVTAETQYGKGATYHVSVEEAALEGTESTPLNLAGNALVHHGEITSDPDTASTEFSYYLLSVTANTDYLVDLRGMHEELDMITASDSSFTTNYCSSSEFNLVDESCIVNSDTGGNIYVRVGKFSVDDITDTFVLSAMPAPSGAVSPARYPDEGTLATPLALGPGLPLTDRLSTVGAGTSYYSIDVTPGSTIQVSATNMNADVDFEIYADAGYSSRLCVSRNTFTTDDNCSFIVPSGINTAYIQIHGNYTTNNGSWSSGTQEDVGAMFRLTIEQI